MFKVTITVEAIIDAEELDNLYNKECVVDQVKEHIIYGLGRFGVDDITFHRVEMEEV